MTVPFFGFGRLKKGTLSLDPAFFNLQDSIILGFRIKNEIYRNTFTLFQENESDDSLVLRYTQIVKDTTALIVEFAKAAEILMVDVLKSKGFTGKATKV